MTNVINGETIVSNLYMTIAVSATQNPIDTNKVTSKHTGLSTKNRNIVIGCCVGIGVPILFVLALIFYWCCIREKHESFIDSDGQIITTYRDNAFVTFWYRLFGATPHGKTKNKEHSGSPIVNDIGFNSTDSSTYHAHGGEDSMFDDPTDDDYDYNDATDDEFGLSMSDGYGANANLPMNHQSHFNEKFQDTANTENDNYNNFVNNSNNHNHFEDDHSTTYSDEDSDSSNEPRVLNVTNI